MKRIMAIVAGIALALALLGGSALAEEHDHDHGDLPEHPHVLLLHFEVTGPDLDDVEFSRCIDLAGNRALPLNAHHHSVHTGTAGFGNPDVGLTKAGHVVVPLQPFPEALPFENCADIEDFLS